jgi:hypothetical protein
VLNGDSFCTKLQTIAVIKKIDVYNLGRGDCTLDIGNGQPKEKNKPHDTYPVVREDDTCLYWEYTGGESLALMRECWYCKYSDFRKDISEHRTRSVFRCPANQSDEEQEKSRDKERSKSWLGDDAS